MKLILPLLALVATLSAADPMAGTWKMNLTKSKYTVGAPPKEQTVTITDGGKELTVKLAGVASTGAKMAMTYTIPAGGGKGKVVESTSYDGVSSKAISANERELTYMKGGKGVYTAHSTLSADGKTLTVHGKGTNSAGQEIDATAVYDRQ